MEEVNPYARLGVERDADAKAIKKAYVGLIRQFPPETHPEEFKAIRAAYELLSDPEARARYDEERRDYAELSEVEARALKVAEELLKSGKEDEAVKVYADLVQRQPTTTEGRVRLGSLLLQLGRPSEAVVPLRELVERRPELGPPRLQLALTYGALNQHSAAADQLRQAVLRLPEELEPRMLLAECCKLLPALDEADRALAEAEKIAKTPFDQLKVLEVWIYLRYWRMAERNALGHLFHRAQHFTAQQAFDRVRRFQDVARQGDTELLRFATIRLAAVAGRLFANNQMEEANTVLGACAELQPDNLLFHPVPPRIELGWGQVPEALRAWLLQQKRGDGTNIVLPDSSTSSGFFWLLVVLLGGVVLVRRLSGAELPILDVGLWLAMVVSGITALYRDAQKKPDDRPQPMFVFHPYYLVQVLADRLYLWPWLHLSDINIVRNNSQFTLTLLFGNRGASWVVWSEEQARRWAGQVSFHRRQLLEALTSGVLDAVPGVDFAPPSRLPTRPELPSRRSPLVGVVVVAILLGLVAAGVTLYQTRWQRVVGADTVDAYQGWADGAATPAQRELALARSAALEQDAKEFFLQTVDPAHPGIVGLLAAAEVLPPGRVLPIVDELRGESYLQELSYILELRGNYLRLAPIPVTQSREKLPAWMVLTRQDDREKVEIFVGGKSVFEGGLTSTAPSRAGRLAEALGLGRLPSAQRWVRLRSSSKNPYALGKQVSGGAR